MNQAQNPQQPRSKNRKCINSKLTKLGCITIILFENLAWNLLSIAVCRNVVFKQDIHNGFCVIIENAFDEGLQLNYYGY